MVLRIAFFLQIILILSSCDFSGEKGIINKPGHKDSVNQSGEWGKYSVRYPVYGNSFTDSLIRNFTDSLISGFKPTIKYALEEKMKYEMDVNYKEYFADPGIVSVVFNIYQFTGGAHGNTFMETYVIDSKNNKRLALSHFIKGDEFKSVQKKVRKKLKEKLGYSESVDDGTATLDDFSAFAVTNDKFIFWFSPYQVASYADGLQEVEIPRGKK